MHIVIILINSTVPLQYLFIYFRIHYSIEMYILCIWNREKSSYVVFAKVRQNYGDVKNFHTDRGDLSLHKIDLLLLLWNLLPTNMFWNNIFNSAVVLVTYPHYEMIKNMNLEMLIKMTFYQQTCWYDFNLVYYFILIC